MTETARHLKLIGALALGLGLSTPAVACELDGLVHFGPGQMGAALPLGPDMEFMRHMIQAQSQAVKAAPEGHVFSRYAGRLLKSDQPADKTPKG